MHFKKDMNKLTIIIYFLGFCHFLNANSQESSEIESNFKEGKYHPIYLQYGLDTLKTKVGKITNVDSVSFSPYKILHFYFREKNQENPWPYGAGYLIADDSKQNNKVIWYNLIYGDFGPHSFSWIDFDNDGDKDLYHLIGIEDVSKSLLFLNQIGSKASSPFKMIFKNKIAYCAVVDLNLDGIPEILNQIKKVKQGYADFNTALDYELEDSVREKIVNEYNRIVGDFDKCNAKYGMPNHYKEFSFSINSDINILSVNDDTIVNVSAQYPEHFCIRKDILRNINNAGDSIKSWFSELENHYNKLYKCEE